MRPVDADLMKESIVVMDRNLAEALREWIDAQPTIEPQRIRGRWKTFGWNGVYCECSECGNTCSYQFNFCPNCGADMRGGQDD